MESGIYQIINTTTDKSYIGSSNNIYKRITRHSNLLKKGLHPNIHLQRAFDKYGEVSFEVEVLEYCESDTLIEREQYYIDLINPEYNICQTAGSSSGVIRRQETKDKISNTLTGRKLSIETATKIGISNTGKKRTDEQKTKMSISKLGKNNPVFKTGWDKQVKAMTAANTGKKRDASIVKKIADKNSIAVIQLDLKGNFIKEWKSMMDIERELGYKNGDISAVCKGAIRKGYPRKTAYNYKWKYKTEYDKEINKS